MQETNLQNLVINKVENQEVYDALNTNGDINDNELYLVGGDSSVDSVNGQTGDVNLDIPVVHKVESQDAYDEMVTAGQINDGELYLVQGDEYVQYTEQTLTEEQKAQARENIDVYGTHYGWEPITLSFKSGSNMITRSPHLVKGEIHQINYEDASQELQDAWSKYNYYSQSSLSNPSLYKDYLESMYLLCMEGVFGEDMQNGSGEVVIGSFVTTNSHETLSTTFGIRIGTYGDKKVVVGNYKRYAGKLENQIIYYDYEGKEIINYTYLNTLTTRSSNKNVKEMLFQVPMATNPTEDMHIATKKYVDNKVSDKELILTSSTESSTKKFKITVDDSGTISATEVN